MVKNIVMPAEWECDGPVLMALPHPGTDWNYILDEAIDQFRRLIAALTGNGEEVVLLVHNRQWAEQRLAGLDLSRVTLMEIPFNDTWTRDYGVLFCREEGRAKALDFGFNGWGLKFAADLDNRVNASLEDSGFFAPGSYRDCRSFILEGGSVESDGKGTLLTTSTCLLSPNRNPGLTRKEIESRLKDFLGFERVLWLDTPPLPGDDTDAHIDTIARMSPGDTIVYTEGTVDREALSRFKTSSGSPYRLVALPMPSPVFDDEGNQLPATYANYLVTPRGVYMPVYGQTANDRKAVEAIKEAFPVVPVISVDCTPLIKQHGSLHCSTMQLDRSLLHGT